MHNKHSQVDSCQGRLDHVAQLNWHDLDQISASCLNSDVQASVQQIHVVSQATHMDEGTNIFTSLNLLTLDAKTQQTYLGKIASPSLPVAISFLVFGRFLLSTRYTRF